MLPSKRTRWRKMKAFLFENRGMEQGEYYSEDKRSSKKRRS